MAFQPPLPPNRTGSFPAYGSPVGSFFIETGSLLIAHELLSLWCDGVCDGVKSRLWT